MYVYELLQRKLCARMIKYLSRRILFFFAILLFLCIFVSVQHFLKLKFARFLFHFLFLNVRIVKSFSLYPDSTRYNRSNKN